MQVYLSVRGYETQMSSAFFEALKVFSDTPERLAKGIEAVTTGRSSWLILMERIAQALPQAELLFWRQEDYARDAQPIVERFLGRSLPPLPDLPRPQSTASPNANALAEVAGLDPSLPKMQRHGLVEEIYARHPRGQGPEPDLLSAEQREALRAAYARDIDAMWARFTDIGQADADQKAASGPAAEGGAQ
jgi:hypothetical protein